MRQFVVTTVFATSGGIYAFYWVRKEVQRALAEGEYPVAVPAYLGAVAAWREALSGLIVRLRESPMGVPVPRSG